MPQGDLDPPTLLKFRRIVWAIAGLAAAAAYLVALARWQWPARDSWASLSECAIWGHWIVRFAAALPFILTPLLLAPVFASEKERGTVEALCLTPLSRRTLVRGRVNTAWRPVLCYVIATLPLVMFLPRSTYSLAPLARACPGGMMFSRIAAMVYWKFPEVLGPSWKTAFSGAAAWAGLLVQTWALMWIVAAISLRARDRLRSLIWGFAASGVVVVLTFVSFETIQQMCFRGTILCRFPRTLILSVTVGQAAFFGLLGLWLRRLLPQRFDEWALGEKRPEKP